MSESLIVLTYDAPMGCLALTLSELYSAQARAREMFPVETAPASLQQPCSLLDATEAARVLKVDPSWLLRAARERRIPFVQLGKYVRFNCEELISLFHVTPASGPSPGG